MSFFSDSSQKKESDISLIFDISSRGVGGALVRFLPHGKPKIYYTARKPLSLTHSSSPKELVASTLSALKSVAHAIEKEGIARLTFPEFQTRRIDDVSLIFSAPWYLSQTKVLLLKKEKPFVFTQKILDTMLAHEKTEHEKALNSHQKSASHATALVEQKIIQIRLNGYETAKPFGKSAHHAEVAIFSSFVDRDLLVHMKEIILHSFRPSSIDAHTFPTIAYSAIRNTFPDAASDYLLVDLGAEATEVSLVKNGALLETFSFPIGHGELLRRICTSLDVSREVALASFTLFMGGKTFTKTGGKMEEAVSQSYAQWVASYKEALANFSEHSALPTRTYLIGESAFHEFFKRAVSEARGQSDTKHITILDEKTVAGECDQSGHGEKDVALSLEAMYLNAVSRPEMSTL